MQPRRGSRPSQVRPRPPSTGRPAPVRVRPIAPTPTRLAPHRRVERRRGLPLAAQGLLALAVVALGLSVLWVASGGIAPVVAGIASAFGGVIDNAGRSQAPTVTPPPEVAGAPSIVAPKEPLTNLETVDVTVTIPADVVGRSGYAVRLYVTLPEAQPTVVREANVGSTAQVVLAGTPLAKGTNIFHATLVGPGGESAPSAEVRWLLDQAPPKVTITSPRNNAATTGDSVTIEGKTQGRSTVVARNEANGATATTNAASDGTFSLRVPVTAGINGITVTATDPAHNAGSSVITIRKGSGDLTARLSADAYRFRAKRLPDDVEFVVLVTAPNGRPLAGARTLFTIQVPGLEAIVSPELETAGDGTATFRVRIPRGAQLGSGLASVLVTTDEYGTVTDRQVITIVE